MVVNISPEIGGRVAEVFQSEGDQVEAGDILFRLDADALKAQRNVALAAHDLALAQLDEAKSALEAARAVVSEAQAGVEVAAAQYELTLDQARSMEEPSRIQAWNQDNPTEFSLPVWYFQKEEEVRAAEAEVDNADQAVETETTNYETVRNRASQADLKAAEDRLAEAQAAFVIADELLNREVQQEGKAEIEQHILKLHDDTQAK